jgi:hypothetical protein
MCPLYLLQRYSRVDRPNNWMMDDHPIKTAVWAVQRARCLVAVMSLATSFRTEKKLFCVIYRWATAIAVTPALLPPVRCRSLRIPEDAPHEMEIVWINFVALWKIWLRSRGQTINWMTRAVKLHFRAPMSPLKISIALEFGVSDDDFKTVFEEWGWHRSDLCRIGMKRDVCCPMDSEVQKELGVFCIGRESLMTFCGSRSRWMDFRERNRESKLYASRSPAKRFHQCRDLKFQILSKRFQDSLVQDLTSMDEDVVSS